jgi:filamentous hemagglutinin family protein
VLPFVPDAAMLPMLVPGFKPDGATVTTNGTLMTINQGKDKVIIDWSSFNIGSGATVRFNQGSGTPGTADWKPDSNYAVLNRIYDLSPSVINGSLQADGRVYLINRNGVFFGPQGKVQVQSLVASAFDISDADFTIGRLRFSDDHYDSNPNQPASIADSTTISNEGAITTNSTGSVFFVGPRVQNLGTISAPGGKIDLVGLKANGQVEITEIMLVRTSPDDVIYSDPSQPGDVANMKGGSLLGADGGWIGLYGGTVRNDGIIRAVTTRRQNGVVYLRAKDLVATGEGSTIDVDVSDASDAMGRTALDFSPGIVALGGISTTPVARIDHEGSITAHSGNVSMDAGERAFLGANSSIDVSGLVIERPMSDQFIDAQLNSLYLRDDYGQKSSSLLLGSTITVDVLKGSSIGNLSSYYLGMYKNARDLSTVGGTVTIGSPNATPLNDIIISRGATIDISGGSVTYSGGAPASTKVIGADGRVYDISNAPQWMTYTGILGSTVKKYGKFGSETLQGISFGGHMLSLNSSKLADRVVGGDAGSLTLGSRVIEGLDDGFNLRASVTTGLYQTVTTPHLDTDKNAATTSDEYQRYLNYLVSLNRGLEAPTGATVVIGNKVADSFGEPGSYQQDAAVSSVVVKKSVPSIANTLNWDDVTLLDIDTPTEISADMLNKARLAALGIYANTSIKTEKDAEINLRSGGSYSASARRMEFLGSLSAPGGSVDLLIRPNITSLAQVNSADNSLYRSVLDTIYLGSDSRISTAGERIDNSQIGLSPLDMRSGGFTSGGSITLRQVSPTGASGVILTPNNENSIVVKDGALLDVSGGWLIDANGAVSGGNAGTLTVKAPTISLGGDLRGFSLPGNTGGEIILHAQEVQVVAQGNGRKFDAGFGIDDTISADLVGRLVLGADRFQDSGFTRISLNATNNLTVADGVQLTPSIVKSVLPGTTATGAATCNAGECFSTTYPTFLDQIGKTYLSLTAGKNVISSDSRDSTGVSFTSNTLANLSIAPDAALTVAPGGSIALNAPYIDIAGTLSAPGGTVTATSATAVGSVTLRSSGRILAAGYNKTGVATQADQPAPLPVAMAGGTVALSSNSSLILEAGSLVDVSGSDRSDGYLRDTNGVLTPVAVAGDAGSLTLAYGDPTTTKFNGTLAGAGKMVGTRGGKLTVNSTISELTINAGDVERYQGSGFDDLTFSSQVRVLIPKNLDVSIGRSLTLDTPIVQGSGTAGDIATIRAPWIKLSNSGDFAAGSPGTSVDPVGGSVNFLGTYLDVYGSMLVQGFSQVNLSAEHDMTFADRAYTNIWSGALGTTANLTLQAGRIYPTSASAFTITTPGTVTILPGAADTSPIYSAGGSLTIAAAGGIDHRGFLAAPQGNITLDSGATGRVDLEEGSVITTAGSAPVAYGTYDGSTWLNKDAGTEVTAAPSKSITLKGNEVVVRDGAIQDLSGGGSVYASYWQAGIPGTYNPLTISGRYVILPDGSATRPGDSVYLDAMPSLGLKAGVYSLLPMDFAFVPGALVIQVTGKQLLPGVQTTSKEKYPVVGGYMTVRDTSVSSQVYKGFSVRRAEDVLQEGDFTRTSFSGGDAGSFTFNVNATGGAAYFAGTLKMDPLAGYKQGNVSFVTKAIEVVDRVTRPTDFSQLPPGTLQLDGNAISRIPIGELQLGDASTTTDITVKNGVSLSAANVTLTANAKDPATHLPIKDMTVTLDAGAQVNATNGYASIETPNGTFMLGDGAKLTAKGGGVKLDVNNTLLTGIIDAGANGNFSVTANGIKFDDATAQDGYFHMTSAIEGLFSTYKSFTIASRGDMWFLRDVDLKTGSLTIDAARYLGASTVKFSATNLTLLNSVDSKQVSLGTSAGSSLSFSADNITIAPRLVDTDAIGNKLASTKGNLAFDQFETVNISSTNDLVFKGAGTITTAGNLNLYAARITTAYDRYKADGSYSAANITIDGRNGAVTLNGSRNNGTAGQTSIPGGGLQILGSTITQTGGLVDVAAGQIGLTASGDISISGTLSAKGSELISASGEKVYYDGGGITLQSDGGNVELKSGGKLDVSAAAQGDAGSIVLSAAKSGGVTLNAGAQLNGTAGANGTGGSLSIDSATMAGVGGLDVVSSTLAKGGFTERINLRSRSGDLALSAGNTLTGREVVVAADGGSITIGGSINADTTDGSGRIELYSGKDPNVQKTLTLQSGSSLSAKGTAVGANGGTVILSSQDGSDNSKTFNGAYALNVNSGSAIDVAGNGGTGGTVHFRAYRNANNNDVNMGAVGGSITGADRVEVEAVKSERFAVDTTILQANLDTYTAAATTFMGTGNANADAVKARLFGTALNPVNHLQAGIEIAATATGKNLTIGTTAATTALDLSTVRPGGEALVLTLKSGKDLLINQRLSDAPTTIGTLYSKTMKASSVFNLVAGSDGGANYMGVAKGSALTGLAGTGDLTIANGKWVYTEDAPVRFAAGNDANFNGTATGPNTMINGDMKYNLGSYGGAIRGDVGRDLNLTATGSAIQTALGDISIRTGRDLNLGSSANTGAIRTTGEFDDTVSMPVQPGSTRIVAASRQSYWTYHNGGSIRLNVGNNVQGNLNTTNGWDEAYVDSSLYDSSGRPKAANFNPWYLAAGFGGSKEYQSVSVPVTVGIATMGGGDISVRSGGSFLTQAGAFGTSNRDTLTVSSGGGMTGRFRVMNGSASLTSGGDFGTKSNSVVTELGDAQVSVAALGDLHLGTVQNPDNTRDRIFFGAKKNYWNMTYTEDSSFSAASLFGDATLDGTNGYAGYATSAISSLQDQKYILPASFELSAAGDINVLSKYVLAPSEKGNLGLFAGGSIAGVVDNNGALQSGFTMQDVDLASMYDRQPDSGDEHYNLLTGDIHTGVNHLNDTVPAMIKAGKDITALNLKLNKPAQVAAGNNITRLNFIGQNTSTDSVTSITAGGNIDQGITAVSANTPTISIGGPGTLLVQAGGNISLGNSGGINSVGNFYNSSFSGSGTDSDSDIIVSAGAYSSASMAKDDVKSFFASIRDASDQISRYRADGKTADADTLLAETEQTIRKYFYTYDKKNPELASIGNLDMVDSAISSRTGSIYALAGGSMNIGKTALSNAPLKSSGVTTLSGGDLSVYAGGDINVNESRMMTYFGGDITIWSDQGDINAGRGSKTTISAPTPVYHYYPGTNVVSFISYTPPSAGSGIRALTFDPDGSGPLVAPEAGNIHVYAKGTLDAGEAGIQGNKLFLAASAVLNSQNISFSVGSVGVPVSNQNSVSIGPMTGATDMAATSKMIETMSGGGADAAKKSTLAEAEDFLMKYLDVKVIDLSEGTL